MDLQNKTTKVVINLTYEQLIANPEKWTRVIASKGNIKWNLENQFQDYSKSTKDSTLDYKDYKAYYLKENWMHVYKEADFVFLNSKIEDELIHYFNYQKNITVSRCKRINS